KDPATWLDPFGLAGDGGAYMFGFDNNQSYIGKGPESRMQSSIGQRTTQTNANLIGKAHVTTEGNNELGKMVEYKALTNEGATRGYMPPHLLNTYLSGETAYNANPKLQKKASALAKKLKKDYLADVEARKKTTYKGK